MSYLDDNKADPGMEWVGTGANRRMVPIAESAGMDISMPDIGFGANAYGSQYLDNDTNQINTSSFGIDSAAQGTELSSYLNDPANADAAVSFGDAGGMLTGQGDYLKQEGIDSSAGMSGLDWSNTALDAGKFGLGVASYFQNKPILKEQLTSLKQGNEIGREKIDAWKRHDLAMRNAGLRD